MIRIPRADPHPERGWPPFPDVRCAYERAVEPGYGVGLFLSGSSGFERHEHDGHRVNLCLRGVEHEFQRGSTRALGPGDVTWIPAGEAHGTTHDAGPLAWLAVALPPATELDERAADLLGSVAMPALWRLASAVAAPCPDALHVESLLAEVEACVVPARRTRERDAPWMRAVLERIADEPARLSSLAVLADEAGVHRCHLARSLRRSFGRTAGELVMARRLHLAARSLLRGDEPIAALALRLGFYDQSHLGRHFRRAFGVSPARFRDRA